MSDEPISPAPGLIKLKAERPLRMAAVTPKIGVTREPILCSAPIPGSAVSPYLAPISFAWRDEPLAQAKG